eukprot:8177608-Pyramimonas_sp.AAC.1
MLGRPSRVRLGAAVGHCREGRRAGRQPEHVAAPAASALWLREGSGRGAPPEARRKRGVEPTRADWPKHASRAWADRRGGRPAGA